MKINHIFATASVAALLVASSANALTYATTITPEGGTTVSRAVNTASRTDPGNALGAPNATPVGGPFTSGFFSLGLGKYADFTFDSVFSGNGVVYEVTNSPLVKWPEFADVYVFNSSTGFASGTFVKTVSNSLAVSGATFTFSGIWDTLRIWDVTKRECGRLALDCSNSAKDGADGFDVDAVGVSVVPLPAAAWLLLGVSGALFAAKRRHSRKTV